MEYKVKLDRCAHCPPKHNEVEGQSHVHEFLGSTKLAEQGEDRHKHVLLTNTDFFINHHHELGTETDPAIDVGNGKHVHLVNARTTIYDGHFHEVIFVTLIEDPIS